MHGAPGRTECQTLPRWANMRNLKKYEFQLPTNLRFAAIFLVPCVRERDPEVPGEDGSAKPPVVRAPECGAARCAAVASLTHSQN